MKKFHDQFSKMSDMIMETVKQSSIEYAKKIEEDLQELCVSYAIEDLTFVSGSLPKGIKPIREYILRTDDGKVLDRRWLVLSNDIAGIPEIRTPED